MKKLIALNTLSNKMLVNVAGITFDSIVDGPGLRNTLFVQGCSHHCPGCHNPETWTTKTNKLIQTQDILNQLLSSSNKSVTFSGGEPFEQAEALTIIAKELKNQNFNLWSYSGYTFEQIKEDPTKFEFLKQLDVLVDGRFILEQKSLTLKFKGSHNQRLIDVQKSLQHNKIVPYEFEPSIKSQNKEIKLYI